MAQMLSSRRRWRSELSVLLAQSATPATPSPAPCASLWPNPGRSRVMPLPISYCEGKSSFFSNPGRNPEDLPGCRVQEALERSMYSEGLKWCLALQLLLPHCFLETRIQGQLANPKFAISGSNVSLRIPNLPENYLRLIWFYTADQKILEWETNQPNPDYFKTKFKDRVTLGLQDGTLHIYNVQEEDSSIYMLKVMLKSGFEEEWSIPLKVFDPVPKPDIKIEKTQEMNNSCYLILSCMARNPSVMYTWYGDSGPISERLQNGVLNITVIPQNSSKFYRCEVSNPVSYNSDTVYFISPCKLAQSSGVAWIPMWLMVMVPTILGLLLI
ncbi:hypothetical protein QTO34_011608 [Cnephaeus nilssonii]|uniref:Ig-like domain-containing protein n=1 Tax=Cnephaeus nilssonii TaxID=3371016 RepID=A0AA40HDT7_CNENI|nr:hypothetical protein QTO34_011608 [Eptesicus nilssonii]